MSASNATLKVKRRVLEDSKVQYLYGGGYVGTSPVGNPAPDWRARNQTISLPPGGYIAAGPRFVTPGQLGYRRPQQMGFHVPSAAGAGVIGGGAYRGYGGRGRTSELDVRRAVARKLGLNYSPRYGFYSEDRSYTDSEVLSALPPGTQRELRLGNLRSLSTPAAAAAGGGGGARPRRQAPRAWAERQPDGKGGYADWLKHRRDRADAQRREMAAQNQRFDAHRNTHMAAEAQRQRAAEASRLADLTPLPPPRMPWGGSPMTAVPPPAPDALVARDAQKFEDPARQWFPHGGPQGDAVAPERRRQKLMLSGGMPQMPDWKGLQWGVPPTYTQPPRTPTPFDDPPPRRRDPGFSVDGSGNVTGSPGHIDPRDYGLYGLPVPPSPVTTYGGPGVGWGQYTPQPPMPRYTPTGQEHPTPETFRLSPPDPWLTSPHFETPEYIYRPTPPKGRGNLRYWSSSFWGPLNALDRQIYPAGPLFKGGVP